MFKLTDKKIIANNAILFAYEVILTLHSAIGLSSSLELAQEGRLSSSLGLAQEGRSVSEGEYMGSGLTSSAMPAGPLSKCST